MNNQSRTKIWIIVIIILVVGGILAWRQWWQYQKEIKTPSEYEISGYNIYKKSITKGYVKETRIYYKGEFLEPGFYKLEDYCYIDYPDKSFSRGNYLKEYFVVDGDRISFSDRRCNCIDGACVKPVTVTSCVETDEGKDIYTKGKVVGIYKTEGFISEFEDYCDNEGSMILESFCTAGMNYDTDWVPCEAGCEEGKCLKGTPDFLPANWPLDKCYDSDGGESYYVKGQTYGDYEGDIFDSFVVQEDTCQNENQLNEGFCINDKQSSGVGVKCPCVDGACVLK